MSDNWRETLFVWDGILSFDDDVKEGGDDDGSKIGLKWEGTWVGCDCADATRVETPKRGAFDRDVTSANTFAVSGTTASKQGGSADDSLYRVAMIGGGYDLGEGDEKKRHSDNVHDIYLSLLRWTGNLNEQVCNLVFALGSNEFGTFISVGWLRVGNRITLARRYLPDDDERCKWDVDKLKSVVLDEIATVKEDGHLKVDLPPWQCSAMHAEAGQPPSKRRKQ